MTEELERGQKMFNQRLLAEHCLVDEDATALWDEIRKLDYGMGGTTFEESIASSNDVLKYAGLEIVGVCIRTQRTQKDDVSKEVGTSNSKNGNKKLIVRYYSIINRFPDDIAKNCFQGMFQPQHQTYVRLVLQKLVEVGPATRSTILNYKNIINDSNTSSSSRASTGTRLSLSQQVMTQNSEGTSNEHGGTSQKNIQLTLPIVEDILEQLLEDKWLVICQDEDGGTKKNSRRSSNASLIDIGPRSYLELSYLLVDEFGMDKDDLPQQIHHRK